MDNKTPIESLDFNNTEIAFESKSNKELKKTFRLFSLMSKSFVVNTGSKLGALALKLNFPFAKTIVKKTIFEQFCGGVTLLDCQQTIDTLYRNNTLTILDFGLEGKSSESDIQLVHSEILRTIELAASNNSVPVVSVKISGLIDNEVLEKKQNGSILSESELFQYQKLEERLEEICQKAFDLSVGVFVDAEESWIQDSIDALVKINMEKFNHSKAIVYNTFQLYRKDRLAFLKRRFSEAQKGGYFFGAKLVRGAYMDKERKRAELNGKPSPIHETKKDTDRDFDEALKFCLLNYETIASCCASHNMDSNKLQANLIEKNNIRRNHDHINFCQLYGMSDYISYNLAKQGYNVAKYVPYGPIKEVVPYLIRRAKENTSVTGEMGRELLFLTNELKRRGL